MRLVLRLALVLAVGLVMGCSTCSKKPDWVTKGTGAFKTEGKVLYGVGVAENITSIALKRTTADNRAIAEVSKQLSTMSTSMMRDYMSSASATEEQKASGEQYVENTVKTFASNTVSGVSIVDRWEDGGTLYSLAKLSIADLKSMAQQMQQLSAEVKNYIIANAEIAFDKLESEQEKRGK